MATKIKFKFTIKKFIILLCSIILFYGLLFAFKSLARLPRNKEIWLNGFNKNVDIYINDKSICSGTDILKELFEPFEKGDKISIIKRIEPINSSNVTFVFHSWHSTVEVYLDDTLLYNFAKTQDESDREIANKYHFVKLPNNCAGKTLKVNVYVREKKAFSYFDTFRLCLSDNPIFYFYKPLTFPLIMNAFLILLGTILALAGVIISIFDGKFNSFIYLAGGSFFTGLWSSCNYGFLDMFTNLSKFGNAIEYDSLFLSVYFYLLMISDLKKSKLAPILFEINKIIKLIYSAILIFTFIAQIFNIMHSNDILPIFHIIGPISILASIITLAYNFKRQELYERILFIGQAILSLAMVIIMLWFAFINFTSIEVLTFNFNLAGSVTMFAIIMLFFANYTIRFYEMAVYQKKIKFLEQMAYNDNLTGLENRQSSTLNLIKIIKSNKDYYCILFDLNNLKTTNDVLGHAMGDRLIKTFADCIKEVFPKDSIKSRIGGDEFLVIVASSSEEEINGYLDNLCILIDDINIIEKDNFVLSTSFGIAHSSEVAIYNDYEAVISLADERMYEQKRRSKKNK